MSTSSSSSETNLPISSSPLSVSTTLAISISRIALSLSLTNLPPQALSLLSSLIETSLIPAIASAITSHSSPRAECNVLDVTAALATTLSPTNPSNPTFLSPSSLTAHITNFHAPFPLPTPELADARTGTLRTVTSLKADKLAKDQEKKDIEEGNPPFKPVSPDVPVPSEFPTPVPSGSASKASNKRKSGGHLPPVKHHRTHGIPSHLPSLPLTSAPVAVKVTGEVGDFGSVKGNKFEEYKEVMKSWGGQS